MKPFFFLLLLLPLQLLAQFGPRYTGPTMQQHAQSRDYFNRANNQRFQDNMQRAQARQSQRMRDSRITPGAPPRTDEDMRQAQALQQKAEQAANDKLAQLAQELQRKRQEHPAPNPQQAAAQQQADEKQLNRLAVQNYRDVFLPGQVDAAIEARLLSATAERRMQALSDNLQDREWWRKQAAPQLPQLVKAYGDTVTALTTSLLGFDLASPPATPAPLTSGRFDALLAQGAFTNQAAQQLVQEAALAEKLIAGKELAKTAVAFAALTSSLATRPELTADAKKLRKAVEASLHDYKAALRSYEGRIITLHRLGSAQDIITQSTTRYLKKNKG